MYWQAHFNRIHPDEEAQSLLLAIRAEHKDYGYRRMVAELRRRGTPMNKKKVQRLMKKLGLQVTSYGRKSRKYNSYKGQVGTVAPNLLKRRFTASVPHQKIVMDTTEFKYYERNNQGDLVQKKAYFDPYMDLYNREIISFRLTRSPNSLGILEGLKEAIEKTNN